MSGELPERARFLHWARESAAPVAASSRDPTSPDLLALARMIGTARVVALGEGVHGAAEPLEFRNRLLQYLVREQGFTAIAIESGLVESRVVHDFVLGDSPGDLATVVADGIGWTFDKAPQNHALVDWMRQYNADPNTGRPINFYGFDVPGSPGNPHTRHGPEVALATALSYLRRVDAPAAVHCEARLGASVKQLRFDFHRAQGDPGYDALSDTERDRVTATIADMVALFERSEARYAAMSSTDEFEWAHRATVGARQVDGWLREVPIGWQPLRTPATFPSEASRVFSAATEVRDRAQADNLEWILNREGPDGKLLVYASHFHLSTRPVKTNWSHSPQHRQQVAGTYLRRRLGDQLVCIGNLVGRGEYREGGVTHSLTTSAESSLEAVASEVGLPAFVLDLRDAPGSLAGWLEQEHPLGPVGGAVEAGSGRAFDILLYIDTVTAA